jgi:hypothetical protein
MKRNKKRVIAAVGVIAALAAGGAAFTDSISITPKSNAGYGSITVNGYNENVSSVVYGFNADGSQIASVDLTFVSALKAPGQYVSVAFNSTPGPGGTNLTPLSASTCTDAVNTTNTGGLITSDQVHCVIAGGATTSLAQNLNVLVTDHPEQ